MTAGQFLTYQLPNSHLELEVPIMEVNFSKEIDNKIDTDRIKPDWEFEEEEMWQFFLDKKDIEIEKVLMHIKQRGE